MVTSLPFVSKPAQPGGTQQKAPSGAVVFNFNIDNPTNYADGSTPAAAGNAGAADTFQKGVSSPDASNPAAPNPAASPEQQVMDEYMNAVREMNEAKTARDKYMNDAGKLNNGPLSAGGVQLSQPQAPAQPATAQNGFAAPLSTVIPQPQTTPQQQPADPAALQQQANEQAMQQLQQLQQKQQQEAQAKAQAEADAAQQQYLQQLQQQDAARQQAAQQQAAQQAQQQAQQQAAAQQQQLQQQQAQQQQAAQQAQQQQAAQQAQQPQQPQQPQGLGNASVEELNRMISQPKTLQEKVDAMEEIGVRGQGTPETFELLKQEGLADTSTLPPGQAQDDANYVRQAALWTMGMLNKAQNGQVPTAQLPGLNVISQIIGNKNENSDVKAAAVQALQVMNRPQDKEFQKLFKTAEKDKNPDVSRLGADGRAGKNIPLPGGAQAPGAPGANPGGMPGADAGMGGFDPAALQAMLGGANPAAGAPAPQGAPAPALR
jgi:multidrug efflux pump subunit AcrA (membrane-fusion protein)